ncbi:TIGR01459 family HAD-type hydrolase [Pseudochrobactrum sp. HB0163]|uniref:TIGR01459 family HAD-type hydrolase n=1 Tax=Pseudochrobactrum sp. HB0163 TaxID=3450708 RepID=UPI003F6E1929
MLHPAKLDDLFGTYDVIFSDVWGVLHNGVEAYHPAAEALKRAREAGVKVVLITNSPRPFPGVAAQMEMMGITNESYDRIVTSGDVTRDLIAAGPRKIFHLGPDRELAIYDGLDVELVEEYEAAGVVCTGLFDDEVEKPEDYAEMLQRFRSRNLPFICANPDIVVERGTRLIWCAGALARDYTQLGGRTLIAGKPHNPIYAAAMQAAETLAGRMVEKSRILAIGDGMLTDVKGAQNYGIDVLYISGGIHAAEYSAKGGIDHDKLLAFLGRHGEAPVATMRALV